MKSRDILTYEQFEAAMHDPQFNLNMLVVLELILKAVEEGDRDISKDDLRLCQFWVQFQRENQYKI